MKQLDPKSVWLFFFNFVLKGFIMIILPLALVSFQLGTFKHAVSFPDGSSRLSFLGDSGGVGFLNWFVFSFSFQNWLLITIPAFLVLCFVWAKLTYRFYRYELLDTGFRKESGVIYKKYVTIPYDRIQNVDINRGILARIFGLSDLNIQTAGASAVVSRYGTMGIGAEGRLPAVSVKVAEQVRDELIERAHKSKNQGL